MTDDSRLIWVLADDRPGNYSQAIGLAEALSSNFQIKKVKYNFLSILPNFFKLFGPFTNYLIGIKKNSLQALINQPIGPQIIISAGRKTAPLAFFLKKYYQSFIIQIMHPNLNLNKFDLVILPEHDQVSSNANIIKSTGSLNRIKPGLLKGEYKKFINIFDKIRHPRIVLLIGGSSKRGRFSPKIIDRLLAICLRIAKNMQANLLIATSRRTDQFIIQKLRAGLANNSNLTVFEWQENQPNPYLALLEAADFIIVTGDSIGMCSEACSSAKPVYIFNPDEICSAKHLRFHQGLFSKNYAYRLTEEIKKLENLKPNRLDEMTRIKNLVEEILLNKKL